MNPARATTGAPTIGVDLGGTNLRVAVVDADGRVLAEGHALCPPTGWRGIVDSITTLAASLRRGHPDVGAAGIGVAALVDQEGNARYAPNIPGLVDAPLRAALAEALVLPVVVDNDANAAAWGEACHGAARGVDDALVVTLGTGVGGGIIAGGRMLRGAHGFAAEIGHWQFERDGPLCACGEPGHWEAAASGNALGRRGREAAERGDAPELLRRVGGDPSRITGPDVSTAARAGDDDALAILDDYATDVALGFAGLVNILDPELIVVSGGLIELGDLLLDPLRNAFVGRVEGAAYRPPVPIVAAVLGDQAGMIGAAALARELVAVKLGLTLPSFVDDPTEPLALARAAEDAGLDGVFVYDHLFRRAADGARRPALEGTTLLAAVAAATTRIAVGALVFRATLRPPATLAAALDAAQGVAGPRLVPTLGSGDHESREENESFGLDFGTMQDRVDALRDAVIGVRDRGYPVWVGGHSEPVRALAAAQADGWNRWGGTPERFGRAVAEIRAEARRSPFTFSWGGLFVLGADEADAAGKAQRLGPSAGTVVGGPERVAQVIDAYGAAGADWVIVGPVDARDAANATLLGERVRPLLPG